MLAEIPCGLRGALVTAPTGSFLLCSNLSELCLSGFKTLIHCRKSRDLIRERIKSRLGCPELGILCGQFHLEYKSKPTKPHPLFVSYIAAALEERNLRQSPERIEERAVTTAGAGLE